MMLVELGWIYHASHSNLNSKHTTSRPLSTSSYIYISISDDIPVIERLRAHHADDTRYFTNARQTQLDNARDHVNSVLPVCFSLKTVDPPLATVCTRPPTHISFTLPSQKKKTIKSHVQAQRCATAVAKATCWWLVVIILTIIRTVNGFCIHLRWSIFHKYPWIWGVALDKHVRNGIALECIFDIP